MIVFDTEDNSAELLAAGKSGFGKTVTQIAALDTNGHRYHCVAKPGKPINPLDFLKWCHTVEPKGNVWGFNTQYDVDRKSVV